MLNNIESINNLSNLSMTSLGGCNCQSNSGSDAFNIVMISLLNAVAKQKSISSIEDTTLDLFIQETITNTNRLESTNSNSNINDRIDSAVTKAANKYDVDENLIRAIIKVESNFDPNCVSSAGAKGLMQLMPENCRAYGVTDPFNIEQNIDAGTKHIKEYIDKYNGDIEMGLMAYNGGPTRMAKRGVTSMDDIYKMPKETQNYVPKVMKYYRG